MVPFLMLLSCIKQSSNVPSPQQGIFSSFPTFAPTLGKVPAWESDCCAPQNPQQLRPLVQTGSIKDPIGVLFCDVVLNPKKSNGAVWDFMAGKPDPIMLLNLDGDSQGYVVSKNTFESSMSWPGLQMLSGSALSVYIEDKDLHQNDFVGQDDTVYNGTFPLVFQGNSASVSCLGIPQKTLEKEAPKAIKKALLQIDQDQQNPLNPMDGGWGLSNIEVDATRNFIRRSAAFLGWEHELIGGLVTYQERMLAEREQSVKANMETLIPTLPSVIENSGISAQWVSQSCGDEHCQIELSFQVSTAQELDFGIIPKPFVLSDLIFTDGTDQQLISTAIQYNNTEKPTHKELQLQEGETVQVFYEAPKNGTETPVLLRGSWTSGDTFLLPLKK